VARRDLKTTFCLRKKRTQRKNDKDRKLEEAKKKYIMKVRKETLDYDKPKKKK
jgi:hypothetical protein